MKRLIQTVTALAMCACMIPLQVIQAEDPPHTDTDYWNSFCSNSDNYKSDACKVYVTDMTNYCTNSDNNLSDACDAFRGFLNDQKSSSASQLQSAEDLRKLYESNAAEARAQVESLQTNIDAKQTEINNVQAKIDDLQTQIDAKQKEIDAKQKEINATQKKIDDISTKIKQRMVNEQSSLKINKYLDILMGASTLEDWFRIISGLQAISESDKNSSDELVTMRETQDQQKKELQTAQTELKTSQDDQTKQKDQLTADQNDLLALQQQAQNAAAAASQLAAEQLAIEGGISSNIDAIKETLSQVAAQDGTPQVSDGWTWPVPGAYRSAGSWTYPDGVTIHLGNDFAASKGTPIVAAANGLIIASANGCGYGYLGDGCGKAQGGLWGGGNQVYELCIVGDSLYALIYAHMLLNSPIAAGTIVSAGDQIGQLGSSGNSTGPHTHVEVTYLGAASDYSSWLASWNGDLGFGCGWAGSYDGYGRRCEAGYSAPCRIRPETVFGE